MRIISPGKKVINLHEIYEGDNNVYLVIDLADGGNLHKDLKKRNKIYNRKDI